MANNCCDISNSCGCGCGSNDRRENKLCELTKPHNQFDMKKILPLVNNPQYVCRCCGRLANEKENLCNPIKLK
jgi:hypothetical protein